MALALVAVLGTLPSARAAVPDDWHAQISRLLAQRAAAVVSGNETSFMASVAGAGADFISRQRQWFQRIRTLPLGSYRLELGDEEYGDLARASDRARHPEGVHILQVQERLGFAVFESLPSNGDVFLTFVRHAGGWSIVSDEDLEGLGLLSDRNLWDFGEVQHTAEDGILVVCHPSQQQAVPSIMAAAKAARAKVLKSWPYPWDGHVVIMVPGTVGEISRILQTTFDLSSFVAFAVSSVVWSSGFRLVGYRVFLHWPNFRQYGQATKLGFLSHEFTHLATRSIAGMYTTSMLDEGVAQYYGEGGGSTTQLRARVNAGTLGRALVPDWTFTAGPPSDIYLAYEEAASFVGFLARRYGRDAGALLYRSLGIVDPVSPGTWRYHLDLVVRALFHESEAALERAWADAVYRDLG